MIYTFVIKSISCALFTLNFNIRLWATQHQLISSVPHNALICKSCKIHQLQHK